jgi:hypothetical protein
VSTPVVVNKEPLQLFVDQDPDGQVDSVVPVRWCISAEVAQQIKVLEINDPQLLIVISNDEKEVDRRLVSLWNQMEYIQFRRPGANKIHAAILWSPDGSQVVRAKVKARDDDGDYTMPLIGRLQPKVDRLEARKTEVHSEYRYQLELRDKLLAKLDWRLDEARKTDEEVFGVRRSFDSIKRLDAEAEFDVSVPEAMFAKEPPTWMRWLGEFFNFWPRTKAVDQCDLRRRAILSACLIPFWGMWKVLQVALWAIWWLVNLLNLVVMLLVGMRSIDFKYAFADGSPPGIEVMWQDAKPSVWWYKKEALTYGTYYTRRLSVLSVINPVVLILACAVGYGIARFGLAEDLLQGLMFALSAVLSFAIGIGIVLLVSPWMSRRSDAKTKEKEEARKQLEREAALASRTRLERDLADLTCDSMLTAPVTIDALPKRRRTVHLRFQATKASVCRPFAK